MTAIPAGARSPSDAEVTAWIAADPDPATRAELAALHGDRLAERFTDRLHFGTAGLRGPLRAGPNGMNRLVVLRTTTALARWLIDHGHAGGVVVVGRDARHGSADFAADTAAVFRANSFDVVHLPEPVPTPVVAFTTRRLAAVAGVMITASHNPPADNGYKVYLGGGPIDAGAQLIPPADGEIEALIDATPIAGLATSTADITPVVDDPRVTSAMQDYLTRLVARFGSRRSSLRVALTPMHGVGGAPALRALAAAGITDVVVVEEQFTPDPDFPTVAFPNPEEPGAADLLLALAEKVGADIAIALDPDADRCAVGAVVDRRWRMLTGDETGALLADSLLTRQDGDSGEPPPLLATTIVSSTLLGDIAASTGARHTRTLTGFKWLVRAGEGLLYAYEEAIGHCVDPEAVRDKDGIGAAVALALLADDRAGAAGGLGGALDDISARHGVHRTAQVSIRTDRVSDIEAIMTRLRTSPPTEIAGAAVTAADFATRTDELRTDAIEFRGERDGTHLRIMVRPSGTEPKIKFYLEARRPPGGTDRLDDDKNDADAAVADMRGAAHALAEAP